MGDIFLATLTFAFVTSVTPGPNNVMLTASGANFGLARTVPHILGITVGVVVMIYAVGLGAAPLLLGYPPLHQGLKVVGAGYLLWLAWAIARAGRPSESGARPAQPLTLLQAAVFQWVNPKAWIMIAGALPAFTAVGGDLPWELTLIALAYGLVCPPSCTLWCGFGVAIARLLATDRAWTWFNAAMATLLAASVVTIIG
ncbi:MAG: LysE family translocator [Alphaproteobacteria bacterium]|nr:LysE family translocator [Alphaproteobacteria bacterium]